MMDATSALSPSSLSLPSQMWPFGKSATGNKRGGSARMHVETDVAWPNAEFHALVDSK